MKHRAYIYTLALLGALALAAVSGGLLTTSDNVVYASVPTFFLDDDSACTGHRCVEENTPPGVNIGDPISATNPDEDAREFGNTLTYSLSGTDAASFDIDPSTGQLITKAALDYENPRGGTDSDNNNYVVTVTVKDSSGGSDTQGVTITVTNMPEEPGAPAAPTVVSTDSVGDAMTYELKVIWYAPDDAGDGVTDYNVEYKKTTETSFGTFAEPKVDTIATIMMLLADTSYEVRVQAIDGADTGPWSLSSVGSTNKKDNTLPSFGDDSVMRNVLENAEPGLVVGAPVSATDDDNLLPLIYQLHGPDANSFDLQASTGQIRTKRGVVYDFETKPTLNVTVTVSDRQGGSDATAVTISVTNVPEVPSTPDRPTVRATPGSSRSLDVSWKEPDNTGPAITGYDIRYREGNSGAFTLIPPAGTGTTSTIPPTDDDRLTPGTSYEVSVRAKNGELSSAWSAAGTGRTSIGNSEPVFDDRPDLNTDPNGNLLSAATTRTVAENTRPGQSVGRAVRAVDGNGDRRTYRLVAETADMDSEAVAAKFKINESSGQILTKASLNHEATDCKYDDAADQTTCTYTVKVEVWDGLDEHRNEQDTSTITDAIIDDTITVEIMVSDVAERPVAPTVTVTSSLVAADATEASLMVTWDKPEDMGPPLTGYVVECTGDGITPANPCPQPTGLSLTDAEVSHNITGLTPNKPYRVRVRADNAEGQGAWSSWAQQFTSKEGNNLPVFTNRPIHLYVVENAPSTRQQVTSDEDGNTIVALQATDGDNDSLTYRLDGPGAGRFDIDRNGQIRTTSKLNHEDPECNPDGRGCSYNVRVKLSDPKGGSVFHSLMINVRDAEEPPAAPPAPRVTATAGSGWSLEVTWSEPRNTGPPISSYEIQYRKAGDTDWEEWPHTDTSRSTKITTIPYADDNGVHLEPRTQYEVQVRALNGEEDATENWSSSGRGTTGASNRRPTFGATTPSLITLEMGEDTRSGQNIGSAVEATDPDDNRLTYTLEGPGKDSFTITSTGQIRTRAALNYEVRSSYSVTVKVNDGQRKDNSVAAKSVSITVLDRPEPPSAPGAPTVTGVPGSTNSVRVMWDEPANPGPAITHYSVQYAVSGSRDAFKRVPVPTGSADRSVIITGLTAGTRYDVQVRAESDEGHSDWSRSGTGSPNPDVANRPPAFSGGALTLSVAENTPPGADVGSLVAALDPDGDTLTYALEGVDADSFDIIATNGAGQIQTKAALNYEEKSRYSVAVRVRDGRGGTDAVNVTINVTDVDNEAPDTPFAPRVTAVSSTSLQVIWEAPANTGPPITDYDYRYQTVTDSGWTEVTNTRITGTAVTIEGLAASTSYDVEVRATNAEGTSEWSNPGNGATNEPGANNPPVFPDGTSATRSVSASAPTGTPIGLPVRATDADQGDTVAYSLEGRDAASFAINETNGQLLTKSGVTLIAAETYTVTVAADDGTDISRITVAIEATAAPPNNPPVFSAATTTRSVPRNAPAGTSIGLPVTATDSDPGTTLNYTLEGADATSFGINAANGQLLTVAGVTLDRNSYTVTVVASDGIARASITVAIEVTATLPNNPPTFSSQTATRSVDENTPAGQNVGISVSATDADSDDTLNYTLGGTNASSFDIVSNTGQIQTKAALDYETKFRYTVTITVSDSELTDNISVTISVTDMHPGCPSAVGNGSNTGLVNDCEALLDSRSQLEGTTNSLNWSAGRAILQWEGITLRGTPARVAWLNIRDGGLNGSVPTALGRLSNLTYLNLRSNDLTGPIPAELGDLSNLGVLNLHSNELTGVIPSELGGLSNLREMWLHANRLSGPIPASLGNLSNLEKLKLRNNDLSGPIPASLGSLDKLEWFVVHNNRLSGSIPDSLGNMTSLEILWLGGNLLDGDIPTSLGKLSNLTQLHLRTNG